MDIVVAIVDLLFNKVVFQLLTNSIALKKLPPTRLSTKLKDNKKITHSFSPGHLLNTKTVYFIEELCTEKNCLCFLIGK